MGAHPPCGPPASAEYKSVPLWYSIRDSSGLVDFEHGGNSPEQNDEVPANRPLAHVLRVQHDAVAITDAAATTHLPGARDARPGSQVFVRMDAIALEFLRNDRPRSDAAHIAHQNVQQLQIGRAHV